jgi:hypothetical protein
MAWSVSGAVVETISRAPIPGARIIPAWDLGAVPAGSDGLFRLTSTASPPTSPYRLSLTADGFVPHDVWVNWQKGERTGITLDMVRLSAPFSMEFYRQFVRGTYDQEGAPYGISRLDFSPKFYIRTVDQDGRPIEPEVLDTIRDGIARAVPAFTANTLSAAAIESGTEQRAQADGWINVDVQRDRNERQRCGWAYIGANPGSITLMDDVCSCGSRKIAGATVMHEVGHALGFFHVSDRTSLMYPYIAGTCPPGDLSAAEKFHSAIAYSRPRGNTDPDIDPSSGRLLVPMPPILADR